MLFSKELTDRGNVANLWVEANIRNLLVDCDTKIPDRGS